MCTLLSVAISNHSVVSLLFPIYFQCYSSFSASNLPLFSLLSCSLSIFLFTRMFRSSSQTLTLIVVSCQLANLRVFSKNRPWFSSIYWFSFYFFFWKRMNFKIPFSKRLVLIKIFIFVRLANKNPQAQTSKILEKSFNSGLRLIFRFLRTLNLFFNHLFVFKNTSAFIRFFCFQ